MTMGPAPTPNEHQSAHDIATTDPAEGALRDVHAQFNKDDPEVNYVDNNGGMQPCDLCRYFHDDMCDLVVGKIAPQGHCDLWEPLLSVGSVNMMSMAFSKVSRDEATGEMRYQTTASDTGFDEYNSRMTLSLFNNFVKRAAEPLPDMLKPMMTSFWQGGLPYLSLSHYMDLDGEAVVGQSRQIYVDGKKFKSRGVFKNDLVPELPLAAFNTIRTELKQKVEMPVRVSILFLDFEHRHMDSGFIFHRTSLMEKCPECVARDSEPIEFLDGYLIHEALTRVPANKRTAVTAEVEARSMGDITSQVQDAASIVGEALAQRVDTRNKRKGQRVGRSAFVVKSQTEEPKAPEPTVPQTPVEPEVPVEARQDASAEPAPIPVYIEDDPDDLPYGGATTMADAMAWANEQDQRYMLLDAWWLMQDVVANILYSDMNLGDQKAAIAAVFAEAGQNMTTRALIALSKLEQGVPMPTEANSAPAAPATTLAPQAPAPAAHALDPIFAEMRAAYDRALTDVTLVTRAQKFDVVQAPINTLGAVIKRAVEASAPQDMQEMVAAGVAQALQQLGIVPNTQQRALPVPSTDPSTPAPRQFMPPSLIQQAPAAQPEQRTILQQAPAIGVPGATQQLTQSNPNLTPGGGQPTSKLTQMVKRSVLGAQRAGGQ